MNDLVVESPCHFCRRHTERNGVGDRNALRNEWHETKASIPILTENISLQNRSKSSQCVPFLETCCVLVDLFFFVKRCGIEGVNVEALA